jgi:hypothetical protein
MDVLDDASDNDKPERVASYLERVPRSHLIPTAWAPIHSREPIPTNDCLFAVAECVDDRVLEA